MKAFSDDLPVIQEEIDRVLGKCCHITLNTGAEALYINGNFVTDAYPGEPPLLNLARSIAAASGHNLCCFVVPEPDNEEWAWNEVVDQLVLLARKNPPQHSIPETPAVPRGLLARLLRNRR